MRSTDFELDSFRALIREVMTVFTEDTDLLPATTIMPRAHFEALLPEIPIVIGARGTGKSVWHNVLTSPDKYNFIREAYPETRLPKDMKVFSGYSARQEGSKTQPPKDLILKLVKTADWRTFWQAIIAANLLPGKIFKAGDSWEDKIVSTKAEVKKFSSELRNFDAERADRSNPSSSSSTPSTRSATIGRSPSRPRASFSISAPITAFSGRFASRFSSAPAKDTKNNSI